MNWQRIASRAYDLTALLFFVWLLAYYLTGLGGPMLLVVTLVPVALALAFLNDARRGELYPSLGPARATLAALAILLCCVSAASYLHIQFGNIRVLRVGIWNGADLIAGGVVAILLLEYTRRRYFPLFVLNLVLILYAIYGAIAPGPLQHAGISWERALTLVSLEMSTGVFDRLAQLGLTLIGAFILVLAVLRAFGSIDAVLKLSTRVVRSRPHLLPQAAVVGSVAVAAVSGSGAANAATTGSATIPALIKAGFTPTRAAAVETASSLGGQLMPPLMGVAAFMMAEFMGVPYFEVAVRGFAPAIVFFLGISYAVHLIGTAQPVTAAALAPEAMQADDWLRVSAYGLAVAGLVFLMGVMHEHAMMAAQKVFLALFVALFMAHLWTLFQQRQYSLTGVFYPLRKLVDSFALTTSELTVLLATLGILTAAFTVTGIPTKIGVLMMDMASVNLILMVLVAMLFGLVVGMGLPAAPTYLILAVVVAPYMIRAGLNPWAVHFFAFFVAVLGELTPPTSVTAAVAARIADAPFIGTMVDAVKICLPLVFLTGAVLVNPALVAVPGIAQVIPVLTITVGCMAIVRAIFVHNTWLSTVALVLLGLVSLFVPVAAIAGGAALCAAILLIHLRTSM